MSKKEDLKKRAKEDQKKVIEGNKKFFTEFKEFISKGNVLDLAVGVIIGSAFGKIVTSIVDDILMPLIGVVIGGIDFTNLSFKVKDATVSYGTFIQNIIDFLIVAFCLFVFIKIVAKFNRKKEEEPTPEEPAKDENTVLLEEIRDILKNK